MEATLSKEVASFVIPMVTSNNIIAMGPLFGGQNNGGTVHFFDPATGEEQSVLTSPNSQDGGFFGYCLAMDEEFILIGAPLDAAGESSGVVLYLFDLVEGREIQQIFASDIDQNDEFGFAVAWHNNSALTSSRAEGEVPINASG